MNDLDGEELLHSDHIPPCKVVKIRDFNINRSRTVVNKLGQRSKASPIIPPKGYVAIANFSKNVRLNAILDIKHQLSKQCEAQCYPSYQAFFSRHGTGDSFYFEHKDS